MSCIQIKDGLHFKFYGSKLSIVSILESSGLPTELSTELPNISVYGIAKFSWAATPLPTELPTVSIYGSSGQRNLHGEIPIGSSLHCPLSCPLFHIWKK